MNDDTESRKAFEKWMVHRRQWIDAVLRNEHNAEYSVLSVQLSWEAWCAAIKYWDEQINEFSDQPPCSKPKL